MMLFMTHAFNWGDDATNTSYLRPPYADTFEWEPATWPFWCIMSSVKPLDSARFWMKMVGQHVKESNLKALTMDMLPGSLYAFAGNLNQTDAAATLQAGFAAAAAAYSIPFRVDLHSAPLALAALDQPAWVASRCNGDATPQSSGGLRDSIVGASLFLSSLHIRPMMDVLWTTSVQPGDPYNCGIPCTNAMGPPSVRMNLQRDLIVATLTAGPLGIGDMVNGTDTNLLATALRSDSVILKPAHPFLRLEKYYAQESQMLWIAPSVPATSARARDDRRANSFARLTSGTSSSDGSGLWWYSMLASEVSAATPVTVTLSDLFPIPPPDAAFVVSWRFGWPAAHTSCVNNSRASSCLAALDSTSPLRIDTGSSPKSQCVVRPNITVAYKLLQLAPVLPSGWVLLGDLRKVSDTRGPLISMLDLSRCSGVFPMIYLVMSFRVPPILKLCNGLLYNRSSRCPHSDSWWPTTTATAAVGSDQAMTARAT